MTTTFEYNDYYGEETVDKEYKLFTFHPIGINIDLDNSLLAEHLFVTGKWIFNQTVINNLNYYLETYLPKYTTAFLNNKSESDMGVMYIGMSDDGFIQGIPYKGQLNLDMIKSKTIDILKSNKIKSNYDISTCVDIELFIVNTPETYFENTYFENTHTKLVKQYYEEKKTYLITLEKFKKDKIEWNNKVKYYNNRLHIMMNNNDTRNELLNYVQTHNLKNLKVINILKSNKVFTEKTGDEIAILKLDISSPWCWVCMWKDDMANKIKLEKPYSPPIWTNQYLPLNALTTLVDMIPLWIKNENINLHMIKYTFRKPTTPINISYKSSDGNMLKCYRSIIDSGPICKPY